MKFLAEFILILFDKHCLGLQHCLTLTLIFLEAQNAKETHVSMTKQLPIEIRIVAKFVGPNSSLIIRKSVQLDLLAELSDQIVRKWTIKVGILLTMGQLISNALVLFKITRS